MTTPHEQGDALDYILLGNPPLRSPGICTLQIAREYDWDVQRAKGSSGASSKLNGAPIGEFTAEFWLASDEDFARWDPFQRLVESTSNGSPPVALPVFHPDLARHGFTEVCCASIEGPRYDRTGGATYRVKFLEYRPPKPKPVASAKAKPGTVTSGPAKPPDPNADAKLRLQYLRLQAKYPNMHPDDAVRQEAKEAEDKKKKEAEALEAAKRAWAH